MKKYLYFTLQSWIIVYYLSYIVYCQEIPSARLLSLPPSAKIESLGNTFVGISDDVNTIYYNAAAVSLLTVPQFSLMYNHYIFQKVEIPEGEPYYASLNSAWKLKNEIVGVGINYFDEGNIFINDTKKKAHTELLLCVSYGKKFISNPVVSTGLTLKYLESQLIEKYTAKTFLIDIALYSKYHNFGFGFAVKDLFGKIKYIQQTEELGSKYIIGVSYKIKSFLLASDVTYSSLNNCWNISTGIEYQLYNKLFLRAGYNNSIISVGFGIVININKNNLCLDFAYTPTATVQTGFNDRAKISITFY